MRLLTAEGSNGGFSLLEVLIALVITGLALTAIAATFGGGVLGADASDDAATALTLAESKIASAGAVEPLRPSDRAGDFGARFHWRLSIARFEDPARDETAGFAPSAAQPQLYRIAATVAWSAGRRRRQLTLDTLRLGPPPP